ncbi:MAG: hypothetical protein H7Z41_04575, partial [Cytophagales bacterium]|nr:hypothetical protein [Armatimonadota bacterium]
MTRDGGEATAATVKREAVHFEKERGVTEIRILREVAHVTVSLPDHQLGEDRLKVLQSLAAHTVPVFLVKLLPTGFSFAVRGGSVAAAESALEAHRTEFGMVQGLCVVTTVAG